jgi:hypothetical protein
MPDRGRGNARGTAHEAESLDSTVRPASNPHAAGVCANASSQGTAKRGCHHERNALKFGARASNLHSKET